MISISGLTILSGKLGNPAPVPISTIFAFSGIASIDKMLSKKCFVKTSFLSVMAVKFTLSLYETSS